VHYARTRDVAWIHATELPQDAVADKVLVRISTKEEAVALQKQHQELVHTARTEKKRKQVIKSQPSRKKVVTGKY